jgi:hypothetical protein
MAGTSQVQTDDRWERLAPLSGVVFVILVVVSIVLQNADSPEDFPGKPSEIVTYYEDNVDRILAGSWIGLIGAFFLLWFVSVLRSRLRVAEGGTGRLATTAFAGGIVAAVGGALIDMLNLTAVLRADEEGTIPADIATTLYDVQGMTVSTVLPLGLAVLVAATGLLALRTGVLPRWFGIVSLLLAIPLLVPPIAWAVTALALVWAVAVSILLYLRPTLPVTQVPGATTPG